MKQRGEPPTPQRDASDSAASDTRGPALLLYVVYWNPADYPGRAVVRKWHVRTDGRVSVERYPHIVAGTITNARESLPRGLHRIPRDETDDPVIVETWL